MFVGPPVVHERLAWLMGPGLPLQLQAAPYG
jgi:hypothetical protein